MIYKLSQHVFWVLFFFLSVPRPQPGCKKGHNLLAQWVVKGYLAKSTIIVGVHGSAGIIDQARA